MGIKKTPVILWIYFSIMVIAVCFAGCDCDKPTEPKPEELKDYSVYFWDGATPYWQYAYHPLTNQLDSFYMPYEWGWIVPSADGKIGYYRADGLSGTLMVDLESAECGDSLTVLGELPYSGVWAASSDGELLVAHSSNTTFLLRATDYSVVLVADTILDGFISFAPTGQRLYMGYNHGVAILDYSTSPTTFTSKRFEEGLLYGFATSHDETKWFLYLNSGGPNFLFAVYDVATDSIIFDDYITPGFGRLVMSQDGRYVIYTNPGNMSYGPGPPLIYVYDVKSNRRAEVIDTRGVLEPPYDIGVPAGSICVTPDGCWLVVSYMGYPYIMTVDMQSMQIVRHLILGGCRFLQPLKCQSGL